MAPPCAACAGAPHSQPYPQVAVLRNEHLMNDEIRSSVQKNIKAFIRK